MTEITDKSAPRTPVAIEWVEDDGFEIRIEVRSEFGQRSFSSPPKLSPHDTGFYWLPTQF